jgi:hypothetical protein
MQKRQREYSEEPESRKDSYDVVVPLQESKESKFDYFFPVTVDAFGSISGYVCRDSA